MSLGYKKEILRRKYGNRCMLCERPLQKKFQTVHHRQPKKNGGTDDNTNLAIRCEPCQKIIHLFEYGTQAYEKLDEKIEKNMKKYRRK